MKLQLVQPEIENAIKFFITSKYGMSVADSKLTLIATRGNNGIVADIDFDVQLQGNSEITHNECDSLDAGNNAESTPAEYKPTSNTTVRVSVISANDKTTNNVFPTTAEPTKEEATNDVQSSFKTVPSDNETSSASGVSDGKALFGSKFGK